ncbi:hypothetical protein JKF63_00165 [Porcisia hertigi]|uniref:Uncharacterized protein n=1 Tax=Porcisia hertigi TaxID=2761500 RepID=A0A836I4I2_9TRYP|nr:hypothetical protein JKF63_00165 [Porcisia hertigi]
MRNQFHRLRHTQQQQAIAAVLARYRSQSVAKTSGPSTSQSVKHIDAGDSGKQKGSGDAGSSAAASVLQTAILLCTEAMRLLNSEVRSRDNLSDVSQSSPAYGSEIGKLLNTAAAFGASTTFPRVQQALHWIKLNKDSLHTPRQVMSLCMPLINLSDGPTVGVAFVLEELYEPLLFALQDVASTSPGSATESADTVSSSSAATVQQHLVAITSVMGMVAKWAALRLGSRPTESVMSSPEADTTVTPGEAAEELEKMLKMSEASVAALRRQCDQCSHSGTDEAPAAVAYLSPSDVLEWMQCLHGLEKMCISAAPTLGLSRDQRESASRRTLLCYRVLLPLVERILEGAEGGSGLAKAAADGAAGSAIMGARGTAPSVRVTEVVELIQVGLQPSIEPTHGNLILAYALQALPGGLASATVKDLCDAAQVINKVRQKRPSALPASLLLSIQAAFRPAMFLLRETQALQLRASDCGVLLSNLSRWEEVPGVTVSADIVELLSQRFGEQMHVVGANQLVPFVAALARFEEREHRPQFGPGAGGEGDEALRRYRFCTTSRVVTQCVQRAIVLASETTTPCEPATPPHLLATDAAHLLTSFVQLSAPQCADFFNKVEPLFALAMQSNLDMLSSSSATIRLRVVVGDAVQRFAQYASRRRERVSPLHSNDAPRDLEEDPTVLEGQRATVLMSGMSRGLAKLVRAAASPKDLVLVSSLLRRRLLGNRATAAVAVAGGEAVVKQSDDITLNTAAARALTGASSRRWTRREVKLASIFAVQAVKMASECRGVELSALASVMSDLYTASVLPRAAAQRFMRAMWSHCAAGLVHPSSGEATSPDPAAAAAMTLTLSLDNCKTLMDASRSTHMSRTVSPVIFLEVFAAQCGALLEGSVGVVGGGESTSTARGTARAYAEVVKKLHRTSDLGRSLVSYFDSLQLPFGEAEDAMVKSTSWRQAQISTLESYLEVAHSVVNAYATEATLSETWWAELDGGSPPPMPLGLLSRTANVLARIYRLVHGGIDAVKRDSGMSAAAPAVRDEVLHPEVGVLDGGLTVEDGAEGTTLAELERKAFEDADESSLPLDTSPASSASAALDQAVCDTLELLGDTIVGLARQHQQYSSNISAKVSSETAANTNDEQLKVAPAHSLVQNPKDLLILLQAFETVQHPHPEMLYSVLPELRDCAERLDPLELSLLIRALTRLGAWNSRLMGALAAAVEPKMDRCALQQCCALLRGLCRSGCTSPDTYLELRSTPHSNCTSGRGNASSKAAMHAPLQRLVEKTLLRLDSFVRTEESFMSLARRAAIKDLVGVVNALRFFHAPPPATYDAFVVLAVRRLASQARRLSLQRVVQHTIALLSAVSELRQPEQQRVSAQTLWTVLRRALASFTQVSALGASRESVVSAFDDALHLHACWELSRFSALHSLQYGRATTRDFFSPITAVSTGQGGLSCASVIQAHLGTLIKVHTREPAEGTRSPSILFTATERAAMRRYSLHASPCLVRGDREIGVYVCAPLKLARLIADGDAATLVHASTTAAPAAQARRCVRLVACLLRTDLWPPPSTSGAVADTQLLVVALRRLWTAANLHSLLSHSPSSFSTEELLVLAAAADRARQHSADADTFKEDYVLAVHQLCTPGTEWRLPAAVDAWMLFAMPLMVNSSLPVTSLLSGSDELFSMLVASGDVLVTRFAHAQRSWATSGSRLLPEVLRLFCGPGELDVVMLHSGAVSGGAPSLASQSAAADVSAAKEHFLRVYEELLCCFTSCLSGIQGTPLK